jgi:hypothetical protein
MLSRLGVEILDLGVIPDVPELLEEALQQAASSATPLLPREADRWEKRTTSKVI